MSRRSSIRSSGSAPARSSAEERDHLGADLGQHAERELLERQRQAQRLADRERRLDEEGGSTDARGRGRADPQPPPLDRAALQHLTEALNNFPMRTFTAALTETFGLREFISELFASMDERLTLLDKKMDVLVQTLAEPRPFFNVPEFQARLRAQQSMSAERSNTTGAQAATPIPGWLQQQMRATQMDPDRMRLAHFGEAPNCLPATLAHIMNYASQEEARRVVINYIAANPEVPVVAIAMTGEPSRDYAEGPCDSSFALIFAAATGRGLRIFCEQNDPNQVHREGPNTINLVAMNNTYCLVETAVL
ncbi:hypothetical protein QOT17_002704 [Balamuthia mandrillaris]